jgi:hypothetical protein
MSEIIQQLVTKVRAHDLTAEPGQWSDAFVYWVDALMPADVRDFANSQPTLEYFCTDGTPHTPAGEGFIDRTTSTAVSFLLQFKEA